MKCWRTLEAGSCSCPHRPACPAIEKPVHPGVARCRPRRPAGVGWPPRSATTASEFQGHLVGVVLPEFGEQLAVAAASPARWWLHCRCRNTHRGAQAVSVRSFNHFGTSERCRGDGVVVESGGLEPRLGDAGQRRRCDTNTASREGVQVFGQRPEFGRVRHHVVVDAGQPVMLRGIADGPVSRTQRSSSRRPSCRMAAPQ